MAYLQLENIPLKKGFKLNIIKMSGRSAVWLAHLNGVQVVGGSNPLAPKLYFKKIESESK